MPARDLHHDALVRALIADGWEITHDPLWLSFGGRELYVDLGATHAMIGAVRHGQKIAVELKSFLSPSPVRDLEQALGQYVLYRGMLEQVEPDRLLYLGVSHEVFEGIFAERLGQMILAREKLLMVVFDAKSERIVRWTP